MFFDQEERHELRAMVKSKFEIVEDMIITELENLLNQTGQLSYYTHIYYKRATPRVLKMMLENFDIGDEYGDGFRNQMSYWVSLNRNMTLEYISELIDEYQLDYVDLSINPYVTWDFVLSNLKSDKYRWDITKLSRNQNITWDHVHANPKQKWDYVRLSINPNIDGSHVRSCPDKGWNYRLLSYHHNITVDDVIALPDRDWSFQIFSRDPKITTDLILKNSDSEWDTLLLVNNPSVDIGELNRARNNEFKVEYGESSRNPSITWDDIKSAPDANWYFGALSYNKNIKWEHLKQMHHKEWDYYAFVRTHGYTMNLEEFKEFLEDAQHYPLEEIDESDEDWEHLDYRENRIGYMICYLDSLLKHERKSWIPSVHKKLAKQRHDQMYSELLTRACCPSRSVFSWNEGAAEQMPEAYAEECARWCDMRFTKA
jgi:hypothetical protein